MFINAGHEVHKEPQRARRIICISRSELCASVVNIVTPVFLLQVTKSTKNHKGHDAFLVFYVVSFVRPS